MTRAVEGRVRSSRPLATVAILDWFHLHEDFLDSIGVSFESFLAEMSGGWLFGYIEALRLEGIRAVFFCFSARVAGPRSFDHAPTGARVCVLPVPKRYLTVRGRLLNPSNYYAPSPLPPSTNPATRLLRALRRDIVPYLATPPRPLARELRREGCDVILCQEYEHARFDVCVLLGRLLRLPVFATFQGGDTQLSRIERAPRPLALRGCAGLVIASRGEIRRVRARYGIANTKIAQIFNPIDLDGWQPGDRAAARAALGIPEHARVAVWHGRVDIRRKGLDVLLEAWARIGRAYPDSDVYLLLVGSGSDADEFRRRIASTAPRGIRWIDEYVHDRGRVRTCLSAADVYAFPSRHEGFPVAPIEAMACGLPLVAADAPGIEDILVDGEASGGIVVPRGDAEAFSHALGNLLDDPPRAHLLGARARLRAELAFSLASVGRQLREFIEERSQPRSGTRVAGR